MAGVQKVRSLEIGRSHIIPSFGEFGFYFKYTGKIREGFKQDHEKIT